MTTPSLTTMALMVWMLLASLTCLANEKPANVLTGANGLELQYLEDRSKLLSLENVLTAEFTAADTETLNFGFTKSSYWFHVKAGSLPDSNWVLEISYPALEKVDVYHRDVESIKSFYAGNLAAPNPQLIKDRTFAFPIDHTAGKDLELFIRVESSGAMQVPITLWHRNEYHAHDHNEQFILGLYYGILLFAILYNLLLAITTREAVLLYYCLYVASFTLFQVSINGLGAENLWSSGSAFSAIAIPLFMATTCISAIVFLRSLLRLDQLNKKLDTVGLALLLPPSIALLFVSFLEYQTLIKLLTVSAVMTSLYVLYAGAAAYHCRSLYQVKGREH